MVGEHTTHLDCTSRLSMHCYQITSVYRVGCGQGGCTVHRWRCDAEDGWSARSHCYGRWFTGYLNLMATAALPSEYTSFTGALRAMSHYTVLQKTWHVCDFFERQ